MHPGPSPSSFSLFPSFPQFPVLGYLPLPWWRSAASEDFQSCQTRKIRVPCADLLSNINREPCSWCRLAGTANRLPQWFAVWKIPSSTGNRTTLWAQLSPAKWRMRFYILFLADCAFWWNFLQAKTTAQRRRNTSECSNVSASCRWVLLSRDQGNNLQSVWLHLSQAAL